MKASVIRAKYLKFLVDRGHVSIPPTTIVPENDPTTLFTGSGMQPMMPYLLGEKHPLGDRLTDSQPSFRTDDIEEVGDNRHTCMFEMLGNWSLGSYWKEEQLGWMFEFLTKEIGLDPSKLYVSVFYGDSTLSTRRRSHQYLAKCC
jgi:alanyl-tRNA synthetase